MLLANDIKAQFNAHLSDTGHLASDLKMQLWRLMRRDNEQNRICYRPAERSKGEV